jgi:reversibly glycosylated polypeptide/UDP-arabinopyranose mutase
MNTAHQDSEYLRGVPYNIREEAPVMLSHGVWIGTPDFDGETQLRLEKEGGIPKALPYYVGPIPKGVLAPICGMNVMIRKEALPYFYFAPMGPDSGVEGLNRFADIWMGIFLKREFDKLGWACYTGGSVIHHTRASDARKNREQEKLGREWNEIIGLPSSVKEDDFVKAYNSVDYKSHGLMREYLISYESKRARYADLIRSIQEKK